MKLGSIWILLVISVTILAQYSCNKDLNALPSQSVVDGNVVVDQSSAEIALNGAYYRFAGVATVLSQQSSYWLSHEVYPSTMSGWLLNTSGTNVFQLNAYTPSTTGDWAYGYNVLNAANATIEGVEALDDNKFSGNRKKQILAEARFLRAYAHFFLLSYFGEWFDMTSDKGVMLRKHALRLSNSGEARSTVKDSYEYILTDIEYAITNAPEDRPVYYMNKAAAQALKLRVLMNRGLSTDYTDAIALANTIIANPKYALEGSLQDLFQVKGLTSKEVILGITPIDGQRGKRAAYEYIQSSTNLATPSFRKLLENDPRKGWMYAKPVSPLLARLKDSTYLTKFFGTHVEDVYAFRLTEVYLLKAEAIVRSGGSLNDARTILKTIMGHAGVTDFSTVDAANTSNDLIFQVYLEFSRNMVAEDGMEWFALLRLPFEKVKEIRATITDRRQYIFPIPASEFRLNPSIGEQNTGYPKQ